MRWKASLPFQWEPTGYVSTMIGFLRKVTMSQSRILVVEDEPAIAETILYALQSEGFEAIHCDTGGEGLNAFRDQVPDFVVLDVGLPDITGFDVCREIRKTSDVPILFLTAREGEIDRVVGLEIGADDYVIKPFSPRELTARINAILRRTINHQKTDPMTESAVLQNGRLELVMERYLAKLDGKELDLSRYEFGMLKIFMKHPGRVYSRDQLMEQVWDEPEAALDRTVDAHIKTLRRKLHEIDSNFDPIKTHRGIGYSFSDD